MSRKGEFEDGFVGITELIRYRSSQVQAATWREAKDNLSLYLGDTAMSAIEVIWTRYKAQNNTIS